MKLLLSWLALLMIAVVLPVLFVRLVPWPARWNWRALLAIFGAWLAFSWYITAIHCPLAYAEAERRGDANPRAGCDNNNLGPLIFLGWLLPAIAVGVWDNSRSSKRAQS